MTSYQDFEFGSHFCREIMVSKLVNPLCRKREFVPFACVWLVLEALTAGKRQ